ncbi:MAG: hypothetical protein JWR74_1174 [Polaromonas sp.]|nr:hypothetical protein [Polaromonas sp.]
MTPKKKPTPGPVVRSLILEKAAQPNGFICLDAKVLGSEKNASVRCRAMFKAGELIRVRGLPTAHHFHYHYFTDRQMADAFEKEAQAAALQPARHSVKSAVKKVMVKPDAKPAKDAAIVYPPSGYRFTRIPTAAPRFQAVSLPSFIHGGQRAMGA